MKTFNDLLIELGACEPARIWAKDLPDIETVVSNCGRGDWLLWLAKEIDLPLQELTLAKSLCAKTVSHLMTDERSKTAVLVAEQFGRGEATREQLAAADAAAYAATYAAAAVAAYADAADAAVYAAARWENQNQTANICREVLGQLIIERVNSLLK